MVSEDEKSGVEGAGKESGPEAHGHDHEIGITVNKNAVTVKGHDQTGLSIKEAAIAQGVKIKVNFVLFDLDRDEKRVVGDTDPVRVHEGSRFRAVADDDDS